MIENLTDKLEREGALTLDIKVIPKSNKNEITGLMPGTDGDILKIKIKAVPENNKANLKLCSFLAQTFNVPKSAVRIIKGNSYNHKIVRIEKP